MKADIHLDTGHKTFASSPLSELIATVRRNRPGDLVCLAQDKVSIILRGIGP